MLYCVQVLDEIGRSLNFSYGAAVLDLVREGRVTMEAALAGLSFSSALAARPHCTVGQSPKGMVYFLELAIIRVAGC